MEEMKLKTTYFAMDKLIEGYLDQQKFEGLCKRCPQYMNLWSCPPFDIPTEEYLQDYAGVYLVGSKLPISEEQREEAFLPETLEEVSEEIIREARERLEMMLLRLELEVPGSRVMAAGSCHYCSRCEKLIGMPCRQPGKMRYSLEALGFHVTAISEELLDMPILWIDKKLPEYFTLVHGLLVKEEQAGKTLALTGDSRSFCFA